MAAPVKTDHPILIVGGGISGMTAAVELAEAGREVVLIEKEPYLGGNVSAFHAYFPKLCPPACGLEINYRRIRNNPGIGYYTGAELMDVAGSDGNFRVSISIQARLINNRCTACGRCAEVCPEERGNTPGLPGRGMAAYIPAGLSFPSKYTIDTEVCLREECGKCLAVCDYEAIHLDAQPAEIDLEVHRIILATGWRSYDAGRLKSLGYDPRNDVVTNVEFERLLTEALRTGTSLRRPSDGELPSRIAFVQCAGSRDRNHLSYCSSVCCSATVKQALSLAGRFPGIRSEIYYIDMRLPGRSEALLRRAGEDPDISLVKGKVGRISRASDGQLQVEAEDMLAGKRTAKRYDMVVLATGLVPQDPGAGLPAGGNGFQVEGAVEGIIPAGCARSPMDVSSSVKDATCASLKALRL